MSAFLNITLSKILPTKKTWRKKTPKKQIDPKTILKHILQGCCFDGLSGTLTFKVKPAKSAFEENQPIGMFLGPWRFQGLKFKRRRFLTPPWNLIYPSVMVGKNVWIRLQIWCHFGGGVSMSNFGIGVIPNHQLQRWKWPCWFTPQDIWRFRSRVYVVIRAVHIII